MSLQMDEPPEKTLRTVSFVVHATRGLIRDQNMRRKTMFVLLVVALVLLFSGSTFLAPLINPHAHPGWFIFFWFVCAWLTLTALFLAVFDMLVIRLHGRKAERTLREKFPDNATPGSPSAHDRE
jgi:protein-S-isoprenylcysteine O-methyltransferase Ste14